MFGRLYERYTAEITVVPPLLRTAYLPSLDGFRGISILMVVIGHICLRVHSDLLQVFFNGSLGVYVFFVISGFLITTLLLKEKLKTGTISLKKFYMRRFLRIFPVAYLYLAVLLILRQVLDLNIPLLSIAGAALYLQNLSYFYEKNWFTAHYWSLSVEEQFYLIFPSILKKNFRVYCLLVPALLVMVPVMIFVCREIPVLYHSPVYSVFHFLLKFDGVLVGSFFSILCFKGLIPFDLLRRYKLPLNLVLLVLTLLIHNNHRLEAINHLSSFFIAIIIISNLEESRDLLFRFLNSKWLKKIGVLSYSIYIWQQLFTMTPDVPGSSHIPWYGFPVNVLLLAPVAYLSYTYFESFFLRLKTRFK